MRHSISVFVVFICAFVSACNDDTNSHTPLNSVTGKVIDASSTSFKVCLDCNENMLCDDIEPTSMTAGSSFIIEAPVVQLNSCPKLAVDMSGLSESSLPYVLISPAKFKNVSQLTTATYYQNKFDKDLAKASKKIQDTFLTDLNIDFDYLNAVESQDELTQAEMNHLQQVSSTLTGLALMNLDVMDSHQQNIEMPFAQMHEYYNHQLLLAGDELMLDLKDYKRTLESVSTETQEPQLSSKPETPFFQRFFPHLQRTRNIAIVNPIERDMADEMSLIKRKQEAIADNIARIYISSNLYNFGVYTYQDTYTDQALDFSYIKETGLFDGKYYNRHDRGTAETIKWNTGAFSTDNERTNLSSRMKVLTNDSRLNNISSTYRYLVPQLNNPNAWNYVNKRTISHILSNSDGHRIRLQNLTAPSLDYIVEAKSYYLGYRKISSFMNIQNNLNLWGQVIDPDVIFPTEIRIKGYEYKGLDITTTAARDFITFDEGICEESEKVHGLCNHVSFLRPRSTFRDFFSLDFREIGQNMSELFDANDSYPNTSLAVLFKNGENNSFNDPQPILIAAHFKQSNFHSQPPYRDVVFYSTIPNRTMQYQDRFRDRDFGYVRGGTYRVGEGKWRKIRYAGRDVLTFSIPNSVKRDSPGISDTLAIFEHQNTLRFGRFVQQGNIISQDQTSVTYAAHGPIIEAIDTGKLSELIQNWRDSTSNDE